MRLTTPCTDAEGSACLIHTTYQGHVCYLLQFKNKCEIMFIVGLQVTKLVLADSVETRILAMQKKQAVGAGSSGAGSSTKAQSG